MRNNQNRIGSKSEKKRIPLWNQRESTEKRVRINSRADMSRTWRVASIRKVRLSIVYSLIFSSDCGCILAVRCLVPDRDRLLTKDYIGVCAREWVLSLGRIRTFRSILFRTYYRLGSSDNDVCQELSPKNCDQGRGRVGRVVSKK